MPLTDQEVISACIDKLLENAPDRDEELPSCASTPQATDYVTSILRVPLKLIALAGLTIEEA